MRYKVINKITAMVLMIVTVLVNSVPAFANADKTYTKEAKHWDGRMYMFTESIDNQIYSFYGQYSKGDLKSVEIYDPLGVLACTATIDDTGRIELYDNGIITYLYPVISTSVDQVSSTVKGSWGPWISNVYDLGSTHALSSLGLCATLSLIMGGVSLPGGAAAATAIIGYFLSIGAENIWVLHQVRYKEDEVYLYCEQKVTFYGNDECTGPHMGPYQTSQKRPLT